MSINAASAGTTANHTDGIGSVGSMADESSYSTVSTFSLLAAALGFLLWGAGWIILTQDRYSHLGWILGVVGPILIALGITTTIDHLARRIGLPAVIAGILGSLIAAISTLPYAVSPSNLSKVSGLKFGYGAYGIGLLLGFACVALALLRKEGVIKLSSSTCPSGCPCDNRVHASFGTMNAAALGFLLWGIGFIQLMTEPAGSRMGWILATVGSASVAVAIASHVVHFAKRFGMPAILIGVVSTVVWAFGYLMNAINPTAGFESTWYSVLFACYGLGHLLTAVSLFLVVARTRVLPDRL